jgi:parallel beta-helix repeat protein
MDERRRRALKTLLGVGAISSLLGASILTTNLLTQRHVEVIEQIINKTIVQQPINQTQVAQQLQQYNTYTTNYWDADAVVYTQNGNYYAVSHDGTTICTGSPTSCIQEAINYVANLGGGKVFIRSGQYMINQTILIQGMSDIMIVGSGWSTKLIANGPNVTVIKIGDRTNSSLASQRILISNLYIDGTAQATLTSPPEETDCCFGIEIAGQNTTDIIIDHVRIYNTGADSIYGYFPGHAIIINNIIENTRAYWASIHCHDNEHKWYVINNIIRNSAVGGVRHGRVIAFNRIENSGSGSMGWDVKSAINGGDYGAAIIGNYIINANSEAIAVSVPKAVRNIIIGNVILGSTLNGIHVYQVASGQGQETVIQGNVIANASLDGIVVETLRVIINGNVISYANQNGIHLHGATYNVISSNIIHDASYGANNTYYGIYLEGGSTNNVIFDNYIVSDASNKPAYCIAEATSNDNYNVIMRNYVLGCAILQQGPNTIVKDNIINNYLTENSGVATISAGSTSVTVNHSLPCTPSKVLITPLYQPSGNLWVSNITSTSFTINISTAPSTNLPVAWLAEC